MTQMKRIGTKKEGESETMLRVSAKVRAKLVPFVFEDGDILRFLVSCPSSYLKIFRSWPDIELIYEYHRIIQSIHRVVLTCCFFFFFFIQTIESRN